MEEKKNLVLTQEAAFSLFADIIKSHGCNFVKFKYVHGKLIENEVVIKTITSDGLETVNLGKPGDVLVENQTGQKEQYVIGSDRFTELYSYVSELKDGWSLFTPKGKIDAVELYEELLDELDLPNEFQIIAAWGQAQIVKLGDYLAIPIDNKEIYRVARKEFFETYKASEEEE